MNKLTLIALVVTAIFSVASVNAKDESPADNKSAQTQQKGPDVVEFDKQMAQAQENFKKMQEQMEKIRQAKDPKERQTLLEEHWASMQSGMGMMQGMWNNCMMGRNMMGGHMMMDGNMMGGNHMMNGNMMGWKNMQDYYSKQSPEQMKQHQYMMDQYMGMQNNMMNHMMEHQHHMWMQPSK